MLGLSYTAYAGASSPHFQTGQESGPLVSALTGTCPQDARTIRGYATRFQ